MTVGNEWLVDAEGCSAERLRDLETIRVICNAIIRDLDLRIIGEPMWHEFPPPGGVTGLFLLTESHLSCHTYPESGIATFNLYCCRPRRNWDWSEKLTALLGADRVTIRSATRGGASFEAEVPSSTSAREVAQP